MTFERGPHPGVGRAEVVRRINAMMSELQLENVEVSFLLTDDDRIHELNKIYRHKDRPTDVLAFAMREGDFAELAGDALGDVIVSVPTARKQAAERGKTVLEEVTMLTAHGLLHLLGWDHDTPAKDRRMTAETERLCLAAAPARRTEGRASKGRGEAALTSKRHVVRTGAGPKKDQATRGLKARRSPKG
ncbi:MAG: rRNA maturation RNase YbeY [Labilithrix sp.]|nr:rRNA maturation RNase YbeY [Labilithrix sp.]MCW5815559.1 rRNA maturation RNase YbeY [Labilithrix sp.]